VLRASHERGALRGASGATLRRRHGRACVLFQLTAVPRAQWTRLGRTKRGAELGLVDIASALALSKSGYSATGAV
jgi:hypothetical protein